MQVECHNCGHKVDLMVKPTGPVACPNCIGNLMFPVGTKPTEVVIRTKLSPRSAK